MPLTGKHKTTSPVVEQIDFEQLPLILKVDRHTSRRLGVRCDTGWRRLIGSPKLQIIFHKRATKYSSFLRKTTYKDKGSYESSPPCITSDSHVWKCRDSHSICRKHHVVGQYGYMYIFFLLYPYAFEVTGVTWKPHTESISGSHAKGRVGRLMNMFMPR